MENENKCIFCRSECEISRVPNIHSAHEYNCKYCGTYLLDEFLLQCDPLISDKNNKFKIACVLNERRLKGLLGIALSNKTDIENTVLGYSEISTKDILNEYPIKAGDFLNRMLLNLSRLIHQPFDAITLDFNRRPADSLHFYALDKIACEAILDELAAQGLIRCESNSIDIRTIYLTIKCWEIIENLQSNEIDNKKVFVAMWFNKTMNDYYEKGIKKAIEDAGYIPIRIDFQDFNEKICDEIIAEIRRSKFLIADFSDLRSGVFFEAGFAKGLGREVIFSVRESDVEKLKEHFDTRQYNHIVYESPEDLHRKLLNRILATIV